MEKMLKQFLVIALGIMLVVSGCADEDVTGEYKVIIKATYTIPTADQATTTGTVPVDANNYKLGDEVTLLGNTGGLVKNGGFFEGWTVPGSTTVYQAGDRVTIPRTLPSSTYPITVKWTPAYRIIYNGNGNDGGTVPVADQFITGTVVTVVGPGTLTKSGYTFTGWNTAANGSGTARAEGATFALGTANVTLYAQWDED